MFNKDLIIELHRYECKLIVEEFHYENCLIEVIDTSLESDELIPAISMTNYSSDLNMIGLESVKTAILVGNKFGATIIGPDGYIIINCGDDNTTVRNILVDHNVILESMITSNYQGEFICIHDINHRTIVNTLTGLNDTVETNQGEIYQHNDTDGNKLLCQSKGSLVDVQAGLTVRSIPAGYRLNGYCDGVMDVTDCRGIRHLFYGDTSIELNEWTRWSAVYNNHAIIILLKDTGIRKFIVVPVTDVTSNVVCTTALNSEFTYVNNVYAG